MPKIIFDEDVVTLPQGQNLLDSVVPQQCVCINWKTDGYHQTWVGVPDDCEVRMKTNGDIYVVKKEGFFTGEIVVIPYIIREKDNGACKKVTHSELATTISVDDGTICSGLRPLHNAIGSKFGRLIDNTNTRKAVEACIREVFYSESIFKHYSGITIEWERG